MSRRIVEECIHRALTNLGDSMGEVVFYHLETEYGITRRQITADPAKLGEGLQAIFGSGTRLIIDFILDEANHVKSPPEDFLSFVRGLRAYSEGHFSTSKFDW